jgi:hypothetical protein
VSEKIHAPAALPPEKRPLITFQYEAGGSYMLSENGEEKSKKYGKENKLR